MSDAAPLFRSDAGLGPWLGFTVFVLAMLALDLGVLHRRPHTVGAREALGWTLVWITLALVFNTGLYLWFGSRPALEFLAGYVVEKALSVDNMFVFLVIFRYFAVPARLQHKVLVWGIVGALVMRAAFILAGAALLQTFHWVIYVFGAFLALTGVKLLRQRDHAVHPERNPLVRTFMRVMPTVGEYRGDRFTVRERGRRHATPLLIALVTVEVTDVLFAVDSIPAIFAITRDPFIVYTSNVFALLGLRALYFLLAGAMARFRYLQTSLALVLLFIGVKLCLSEVYPVPIGISLGVVTALIGGGVVLSLAVAEQRGRTEPQRSP